MNKLDRKFISIAKNLRRTLTDAEKYLWKHLRSKQIVELKFRRQQAMGRYIVDFVCFKRRIVIEVDGAQHGEKRKKDVERDNWLRRQGFKVLRFWNNEVLRNINGVLEVIIKESLSHPPLTPPIKGGENPRGKLKQTKRQTI